MPARLRDVRGAAVRPGAGPRADRLLRARLVGGRRGRSRRSRAAGRLVFSNAKNYRMAADVPLAHPGGQLADHVALLEQQRANRGWAGAHRHQRQLLRRPSPRSRSRRCTRRSASSASSRRPCRRCRAPGIPACRRSTSSATSIPYIADEEPKIESELRKLLGTLREWRRRPSRTFASARTPTASRWSTATRSACRVGFERRPAPRTCGDVLRAWTGPAGLAE